MDSRFAWDDLVLPPSETATLRAIASRLRTTIDEPSGPGISALFAGPPGTGKTMAAQVLAGDLNLALYRIDLSALVSQYIGETEKNLRGVFEAAEQGGAILLFDEADALFGKHSEVEDSHDRYANVEVAFLLQQMEAFRGLTILTSNGATPLDPALLRCLTFVGRFPFRYPTGPLSCRRPSGPPAGRIFPYGRASLMAGAADQWQRSAMVPRACSAPPTAKLNRNGTDKGRTRASRSSALPYSSPRKAMARSPDSFSPLPSALARQDADTNRPPSRLYATGTATAATDGPRPNPTVSTCRTVLPSKQSTRRLACRRRPLSSATPNRTAAAPLVPLA
ncbi:MAG: ATP-binding protein [Reyranella sp.]